ncbi:carbamoyltransferase [Arenicella chitinivorans]|uniref:Carbamoyltransferase n=1 Tax=Arenicella chitinivorans TaxID=1329800 RepID=A0A918RZY8_9GAMM|nr:carbamoyltransferase [Arenicella chitinivorans]GHA15821.1 carbamoyltransferase [Arenicella chitinivorans]
MIILGISAFYHDSAAAIIDDEKIIAAAQEERFTRIKHDSAFPINAVEYCLEEAGITLNDVGNVVFFEKPFVKFERLLETYVAFAPRGFQSFRSALPLWIKEKLFQKKIIREAMTHLGTDYDWEQRLKFSEHHLSHAASAFYPSPFEEAIVLTLDGVGEWVTTSMAIGRGKQLEVVKEIHFPHSLGLLYSAVTYYTGFRVNSGEYKVMGLAPYGDPKYKDLILEHIIDVKEDGSYRLDQSYFNYCTGLTMTNNKFAKLFGRPARVPEDELEQFHMDVAASVQAVTEEIVLKLAKSLAAETGIRNICLAGGVALNCVANGKLQRSGLFDGVWIQPAAGDAGGALGAAQALAHIYHDVPRTAHKNDNMQGSYLGKEFSNDEIRQRLTASGAHFTEFPDAEAMIDAAANALANEQVLGWFQGRMEFGPRALGGRSILGDPRSPAMQKNLNLKIKYRESFRPFAPSILAEKVHDFFELNGPSPYMLLVDAVQKNKRLTMTDAQQKLFGIDKLNVPRSEIPAVTHVDYSARIQTVHKATNPKYHQLISAFEAKTGCPLVVNTSFNVRGEPIVGSPEDAFNCFMGTEMDVLAIGNFVLHKKDQNPDLAKDYKNEFTLD